MSVLPHLFCFCENYIGRIVLFFFCFEFFFFVEACPSRFAQGIFKLALACQAAPVPCVLGALY